MEALLQTPALPPDLRPLETVCKHIALTHGSDALRKERNKVRRVQRQLAKLQAELYTLRCAHERWKEDAAHWRNRFWSMRNRCQTALEE